MCLFGWKRQRRVVAQKRGADDSIVGFGAREGNKTRNLVIGDDDRPTPGRLDDWQHDIDNAECAKPRQNDGEKHAKCGSVYSDQEVNEVENTAFDDTPIPLRYPDYVENQHQADDDIRRRKEKEKRLCVMAVNFPDAEERNTIWS